MTTNRIVGVVLALVFPAVPIAHAQVPPADSRCSLIPPVTRRTQTVTSTGALMRAVNDARPSTTILLADGTYRLDRTIDITVPDLVLRSRSGNAEAVVIRGENMMERQVGVGISVSAPRVMIANVTIGYVGFHGVQVRGERGASDVVLHNIHVIDTGQQLVKGSVAAGGTGPDRGLVACSRFEYSDHAPSDYTNGVDVLAGKEWVVRDNRFLRIRGPAKGNWAAGPAILFWANSVDTLVERNVVIDSSRGVAFGLGPGASRELARDGEQRFDHQGGAIRGNILCNLNAWADEGIEANAARNIDIGFNTVITQGRLPWSISVRFPETSGRLQKNLTSRGTTFRNGGLATDSGSVADAQLGWFVNPSICDLRLTPAAAAVVDAGAEALEP